MIRSGGRSSRCRWTVSCGPLGIEIQGSGQSFEISRLSTIVASIGTGMDNAHET
jgi:hypothetical protein